MTNHASAATAQIDWYLDDGVNIPMLNDILRNRFYDQILSQNLVAARCVDIGFGTGLLSMLALKHGAAHVVAFEQDHNRYCLGQLIIQELGLQDQIELHHEKFSHDMLSDHADRVVITETVNDSIFQEGLWNILPRAPGQDFRPGQYCLDLHVISIPRETGQLLAAESVDPKPFCPGVAVRPDFVTAVNCYRNSGCSPEAVPVQPQMLAAGINYFDYRIDTVWGWTPHLLLARGTLPTAGHVVNAELGTTAVWHSADLKVMPIDFDAETIKISVPLCDYSGDTLLVVPRFSLRHGHHQLPLDSGHWGPAAAPVVLHQCSGQLVVEQNVFSGDIAYHV